MSKADRIKRRNRKKKIRFVILVALVIYVMLTFLPSLYTSESDTYLAKEDIVELEIESKGIIIKDEDIYTSDSEGDLQYFHDEGDKVSSGEEIVRLSKGSFTEEQRNELKEIDDKINSLKEGNKSKELFNKDLEKIEKEIDNLLEQIQKSVQNNEDEKVKDLKMKLQDKLDKKDSMTLDNGFLGYTIDELQNRKKTILSNINKNMKSYYSQSSGIVSYKFDNLERRYSTHNIDEFELDDFEIIDKKNIDRKTESEVSYGKPIFKIINNFKWNILTKVNNEKIKGLEEGKNIKIKVSDDNQIIYGEIRKITKGKKESLITIELDNFLYKYYKKRYIDVKLVLKTYKGIRIPNESILENKDGLKGVYVRNIDRIIKFKPIKILYKKNNYTIIDEGNRGLITIETDNGEESFKTVSSFDEIIIDGESMKKYMEE